MRLATIKWRQNTENLEKSKLSKKIWEKNNLQKRRLINRTAEAKRRTRTPSWANLDTIRQIYANCPEGYEVDHIIPLNGVNVSGLHVPENLQYLTVSDNRSKGNFYETL